jgi:hypothetical protein
MGAMMKEYWQGKTEVPDQQNLSLCYLEHHKIPYAWSGLNLGLWGKKLTTHRKSHGTALLGIGVLFAHAVLFDVVLVFFDHSPEIIYFFCECSCIFALTAFKRDTNETCSKSSQVSLVKFHYEREMKMDPRWTQDGPKTRQLRGNESLYINEDVK